MFRLLLTHLPGQYFVNTLELVYLWDNIQYNVNDLLWHKNPPCIKESKVIKLTSDVFLRILGSPHKDLSQ